VSREKVVRFGREAKLVGILSEPQGAAGSAREPMVLLVNSGILHRVGACRFHVRLARRLAEDGVSALRFDFSGIGDSERAATIRQQSAEPSCARRWITRGDEGRPELRRSGCAPVPTWPPRTRS
jgi:hypothetical protein